jgi:hypothetical protein
MSIIITLRTHNNFNGFVLGFSSIYYFSKGECSICAVVSTREMPKARGLTMVPPGRKTGQEEGMMEAAKGVPWRHVFNSNCHRLLFIIYCYGK